MSGKTVIRREAALVPGTAKGDSASITGPRDLAELLDHNNKGGTLPPTCASIIRSGAIAFKIDKLNLRGRVEGPALRYYIGIILDLWFAYATHVDDAERARLFTLRVLELFGADFVALDFAVEFAGQLKLVAQDYRQVAKILARQSSGGSSEVSYSSAAWAVLPKARW